MPETTRTFVAIAIPNPLGQELARIQEELSPDLRECRWTSSLPFHATLAFLGDVRNRDLNDILEGVASGAVAVEPFELNLNGLGAFPSTEKPRVIWAGLTAPDLEPLFNLRRGIVESLSQVGYLGVDPSFHPHVTLGRIKSNRRVALDVSVPLERHRSWCGGAFTVSEVVTFASTLGPGGPRYDALGRAGLRGKKP
jgi:2'-5' RNA ligase